MGLRRNGDRLLGPVGMRHGLSRTGRLDSSSDVGQHFPAVGLRGEEKSKGKLTTRMRRGRRRYLTWRFVESSLRSRRAMNRIFINGYAKRSENRTGSKVNRCREDNKSAAVRQRGSRMIERITEEFCLSLAEDKVSSRERGESNLQEERIAEAAMDQSPWTIDRMHLRVGLPGSRDWGLFAGKMNTDAGISSGSTGSLISFSEWIKIGRRFNRFPRRKRRSPRTADLIVRNSSFCCELKWPRSFERRFQKYDGGDEAKDQITFRGREPPGCPWCSPSL